MNNRVESAERLLSTILTGRAHLRALAIQYLPPGRALAIELAAITGSPPAPLRSMGATGDERSAQADHDAPRVATARTAVEDLPSDPAWAQVSAAPNPDATFRSADSEPSPTHDTSSSQAPEPDEDTSDNETDTGAGLSPDDPPSALPTESSALPLHEPGPVEPESEQHTVVMKDDTGAAEPRDPTAEWSVDDGEAPVNQAVSGDEMHWGDPTEGDVSASFEATAVFESPLADSPSSNAASYTNGQAQHQVDAAEPIDDDELGEDFELSAEELHWGDTYGNIHESVDAPHASEAVAPEGPQADATFDASEDAPSSADSDLDASHLHWDDAPAASRFDAPLPVYDEQDALEDQLPVLEADADSADASSDEDSDSLPDPAGVDDGRIPAIEWTIDDDAPIPSEFDDDPMEKTLIVESPFHHGATETEPPPDDAPEPAPEPAIASIPVPVLAVPRVVEPRRDGALQEATGAAAIQILGVGQAQTLTPTLELGEAPDEDSVEDEGASAAPLPSRSDDGFSLQFEEPDDESNGPYIPELTEAATVQHTPQMLTPDGVFPSDSPSEQASKLDDGEVRRFIQQAEAAEKKGNLREAVVFYDDLLSYDPHNLTGHLGRGRCLVEMGDYGAAMSDFTRAEDIAPQSPDPLVEMGNLFFARKEYNRAITYYTHAIDLDNGHAMAFSRRGISYYHRRKYAEAHDDLTEASKRNASIPGLQRYIQMTSRKLKKRR